MIKQTSVGKIALAIANFLTELGYNVTRIFDDCIQFDKNGYVGEIEIGGTHTTSGARETQICLVHMGHRHAYDLNSPNSIDQLEARLNNWSLWTMI